MFTRLLLVILSMGLLACSPPVQPTISHTPLEATLEATQLVSTPTMQTMQTPTEQTTPEQTEAASAELNTVFVIVMENHNWNQIAGNSSAAYINDTLLPLGAHAEQYYNPPGLHPSEPNYLWIEAGTNFGITDDNKPDVNHIGSTAHLTHLLDEAGVSWKSYQEGITGDVCPLKSGNRYAPRHNPMVYFDDVTDNLDPNSAYCIAHVRPYSELADDLAHDAVPQYNFITPDVCNDMHGASYCENPDQVQTGDRWLADAVPLILDSDAYKNGGVLFITWDEGRPGDGPIGMIVLSPAAKVGYANDIPYTHSSLLRTIQEIFDVQPLLGDAANATDLSDLFTTFP